MAEAERVALELHLPGVVDPTERLGILTRIEALLCRQKEAEARALAAYESFLHADARCASRLAGLCADVLTDSGPYAVISRAERWGSALSLGSLAGRWVPPLAVIGWGADVLATAAATTRYVVWDEGDGTQLSVSLAASVLGGPSARRLLATGWTAAGTSAAVTATQQAEAAWEQAARVRERRPGGLDPAVGLANGPTR